jgi:hypothetical protein
MNRLRIIGVILGSFLVGLIVFVSVSKSGPREPSYQGRTLSRWLQDYEGAHNPNSAVFSNGYEVDKASEAAVIAIGTNAIPTLLEWLQAEDHPVQLIVGHLFLPRRYHDAHDRRCMVLWSFDFLGEKARSAAPALAELTKHKNQDVRINALMCLEKIHANPEIVLSVLTRLVHDPDFNIRKHAAVYMAICFPKEAEKYDLRMIPPGLFDVGTNLLQIR